MYRLLAIDLDGTLLNPQKLITPRTQKALYQVAEMGITLVIATGQTLQVLRHVCADLPLTAPQIIENGAIIADIHTGHILHEKLIPHEYILPTLNTLRSFDLFRAYHNYQRVYVDIGTPRAREWYRPPVPSVIEVDDVASLYPLPCIKLAAVGEESTLIAKRQEFERRFAGKLYVTQSAYDLLEFLHPEVSKGNALKTIAADLGISSKEVVAFGDNHNDIGMLQFAGLGVAMDNAPDEVKVAADYVTLSNSEDGVAVVIEELILTGLK